MSAYRVEFPVDAKASPIDYVSAVKEWVLDSPHARLTHEDIDSLAPSGRRGVQREGEEILLVDANKEGTEYVGLRHTRVDKGIEWVTTSTFMRGSGEAWVSVLVSCQSSRPTARIPDAKKPVLIRTLLRRLAGGGDGELHVSDQPHLLNDGDLGLAVRLVSGNAGSRLPIVYVSSRFDGSHAIDASSLASSLSGMAHVVVEPSRLFGLRLKVATRLHNTLGGGVGILWPDGAGGSLYRDDLRSGASKLVGVAVVQEIRWALVNRKPRDGCSWAAVNELSARSAIDELRRLGSTELDRFVEHFDSEVQSKDQRIADAEGEIARLRSELKRRVTASMPLDAVVLRLVDEQDLYPDEAKGIVLDALECYLSACGVDSRRRHVVSDLLLANEHPQSAQAHRTRLKEALREYRGMSPKVRRALAEIGFEVVDENRHIKLVFQGDDRYTFVLPRSGGDHRGGLNAAGDISRIMF